MAFSKTYGFNICLNSFIETFQVLQFNSHIMVSDG